MQVAPYQYSLGRREHSNDYKPRTIKSRMGGISLDVPQRKAIHTEQPLCLNFPAGIATNTLRQAGFYPHQTLVWMEFNNPYQRASLNVGES